MLTNKLLNIFHKICKSYIFKLIIVTIVSLAVLLAFLESKSGEISFVYNNF